MEACKLSLPTYSSRERWFLAGLVVFFVVLSAPYGVKVMTKESGSAIVRWRQQLLDMERGEDIWNQAYPNPPIMGIMLLPFAHLSPLAGALCWYYAKVGLTLLAIFWTFRLVESPDRPFPMWAKALVVLITLRPIAGDLSHGNVNLLILFLVVAALYAYHEGFDFTAGVVLALSIACKVTPLLFVPYFAWKRAWKTLAGCALGLVLFFWLVPGLFLGFEQNQTMFGSWWTKMVEPFVVKQEVIYSEHNNQSLLGLVFRLTTHSPSFSTYNNHVYAPLRYDNVVELDANTARWVFKGCVGLYALLIVWSCRTPTSPRKTWRLAAEFSLVLLGMLLFSPRTWKHHCVTLLPPVAVIGYYLSACNPGRMLRAYLIGSLTAVVLLMTSTSTSSLLKRWEDFGEMAQVYGAYVWSFLVLAAALIVILRRPEAEFVEQEKLPVEQSPA